MVKSICLVLAVAMAQSGLEPPVIESTVRDVAAIVSREYMDAAAGKRIAQGLRRRLAAGEYAHLGTAEALAKRLTSDLLAESTDKHLFVGLVRPPARGDAVRRTNGGVQRVEILPGNVGYLNLTSFGRIEEAGDAITDAMRLLRRADALIIDMRQNGGGNPGTVVLLMSYLFDSPGLPLFEVVSRNGERVAYATSNPAPAERDGRRPVYVLTSARTFSAGEGFAFLLQERGRATIVGERTPGAANPGRPYPVNAIFEVTVPNGKVVSAVRRGNWEGTGVVPDVAVAADEVLESAHKRALERLKHPGTQAGMPVPR